MRWLIVRPTRVFVVGMRFSGRLLVGVLGWFLLSADARAVPVLKADEVILFGAPWCEGCKLERSLLEQCGISFSYQDVTTEAGQAAYLAHRAGAPGLPLVAMYGFRIQTWDLESFRFLLERHLGLAKRSCKESLTVPTGSGLVGGHLPEWWASQRALIAKIKKDATEKREVLAATDALTLIDLDMKLIKVPAPKKP